MGTNGTMGFVKYRTCYPLQLYRWLYGYGLCGFGYGVGKPDPRITRIKPFGKNGRFGLPPVCLPKNRFSLTVGLLAFVESKYYMDLKNGI